MRVGVLGGGGHAGIVARGAVVSCAPRGGVRRRALVRAQGNRVRALKWIVALAVAAALFAAAVWAASRAMGPTAAEREALALLDAPPAVSGRDGFAALYTLRHDVPEPEQAGVLAEDVRRFAAAPPAADPGPVWTSALQDWPGLDVARQGDPDWCPLRQPGCLERVRAAPQAYAQMLERHAALLERIEALDARDHFQNPFPARFDTPLPAYQPLTRPLTRDAWRFASGDVDAGLAGACAGVARGRRLIAAGDSLIGSMIGAALVEGHATLLAEMLAELPRGHALPAQCQAAFELPFPLEQGVCRAMLAEGRYATGAMCDQIGAVATVQAQERNLPAWSMRLLFDPERTAARGAPKFAWYCGEQARAQIAQDLPLHDPTPPPSRWTLACASNPVGCILADIAAPAYHGYAARQQDVDARLRAMAALLRLRAGEGAIDSAALAGLPAPLQSPSRPLLLDVDAGTLGITLFQPLRDDGTVRDRAWTVPLPASRLQPADASP